MRRWHLLRLSVQRSFPLLAAVGALGWHFPLFPGTFLATVCRKSTRNYRVEKGEEEREAFSRLCFVLFFQGRNDAVVVVREMEEYNDVETAQGQQD